MRKEGGKPCAAVCLLLFVFSDLGGHSFGGCTPCWITLQERQWVAQCGQQSCSWSLGAGDGAQWCPRALEHDGGGSYAESQWVQARVQMEDVTESPWVPQCLRSQGILGWPGAVEYQRVGPGILQPQI